MGDTGKMQLNDNITIQKGDCCELIKKLPDGSVDAIITDPPYLYLKNQKLDKPFDEEAFFSEAKRVLKRRGFVVMFGRGTAFYRWNTRLADLGFVFKEEIIWNKVQTTSPLLPLNRIHETVSIHCNGKGKINKVRVPYLEMKGHDIGAIKTDIKRLLSVFSNSKHLAAVKKYLEEYEKTCVWDKQAKAKFFTSHTGIINGCERDVSTIDMIERGLREKTIIDFNTEKYVAKHTIATSKRMKNADRDYLTMKNVTEGCVEKSIMQQGREHYSMQHPTQKPVRLIEWLMALVTQEGDLVLDPFMGSGSTGIACINTGRRFIGYEIDDEYFGIAKRRLEEAEKEKSKELFSGGIYE